METMVCGLAACRREMTSHMTSAKPCQPVVELPVFSMFRSMPSAECVFMRETSDVAAFLAQVSGSAGVLPTPTVAI